MGGEVHGKASAAWAALLAGGGRLLVEGASPEVDALRAVHSEAVLLLPVGDRANAGVAFGLALSGRVTVLALSSARRLPAIAEVLAEACAAPGRVPWIVEVPIGDAPELDAPCLDALAAIPGLRVACPRDRASYAAALSALAVGGRPAVLLRARALPDATEADAGDVLALTTLRAGRGVTVLAFGPAVAEALRAAEDVGDVEVIDAGLVAPLDAAALGARVRATGRLVVAVPAGEEPWGRRALQAALDAAFLYLEAPPVVCGADAASVASAARAALSF